MKKGPIIFLVIVIVLFIIWRLASSAIESSRTPTVAEQKEIDEGARKLVQLENRVRRKLFPNSDLSRPPTEGESLAIQKYIEEQIHDLDRDTDPSDLPW